jgi:hypothetical protein
VRKKESVLNSKSARRKNRCSSIGEFKREKRENMNNRQNKPDIAGPPALPALQIFEDGSTTLHRVPVKRECAYVCMCACMCLCVCTAKRYLSVDLRLLENDLSARRYHMPQNLRSSISY